jgi:dipeptidyl aminopeptidase/acylaminoacyl peptidase
MQMWETDDLTEVAKSTFFGQPKLIERLHATLHANLHLPPDAHTDGSRKYPAVLLLHGFGGNRHECNGLFVKAAASLALAGFVALRFDFRGAGETGGDTREISIKTQVQDARDSLDHLTNYPFVNRQAIGVLGFSFGGLTAALLAAQCEDVASLALWQPVFDMTATMKRLYGHLSLRAVRARGYMQAGMMQLGNPFFDALETLDVAKSVEHLTAPVLVLQGVADSVVPVETAYQWKRALQGTEAQIKLIPDADHAFSNEKWTWDAIDQTVSFFRSNLNARTR